MIAHKNNMNPLTMGFLTVSIYLTFSFSLIHLSLTQPLCHNNERSALLQFKQTFLVFNRTYFCNPKAASWIMEENSECCSWDGVNCNEDTGYVIKLDLRNGCLEGSINSSSTLFNLVHLQSLYLSGNLLQLQQPGLRGLVEKLTKFKVLDLTGVNISSSIPNSLGNLSSLTHLSLIGCQLQGVIPSSLGKLYKLVDLRISLNELSGPIPYRFMDLNQLSHLDFSSNQLSGRIPSQIGNLTRLEYLDLSSNQLSGRIPSQIGNLTRLKDLDLSSNQLSGRIPSQIGNLTRLEYLDLSSNQLSGRIPSQIGNLTRLGSLDLSSNQLNGRIPSQIGNLTRLGSLNLSSNRLQGPIPSSISELKNLQELQLHSNRLQGPIPSSISKLKNLYYLDLHSNYLNGTVELDVFLFKLKSLTHLLLSSNNLSVLTKTNATTKLQKLSFLGLRACNLTEFPNFLQNQDQLKGLDLSSNKISGQIPKWFFNVSVHKPQGSKFQSGLQSLNLSNNLLTGGFDQRHVVLPWTDLLTLDLRSNRLQGSLPLPTSSINHYLVSNNNLTGEIPSSICTLNQIQALDLSHNNLSGVLPQCLGNFSNQLSVLSLQSNNFYGSIPQFFMIGSSLRMIDLSQNKFQGKIPRSLAKCTSLEFLNLGYNQINDLFPSWLGILPELKVLILKSNRFHGVIKEPKTNLEFLKLHIIDLSHNMFMGELPSKYFQCWNAMKVLNESQLTYMQESLKPNSSYFASAYFDGFPSYAYSLIMSNQGMERKYWKIPTILTSIILSGNQFTGQIPTTISNLRGLIFLNLSNNNLLGHIPSSLGNLRLLESLDLSSNRLLGEIPPQLADLTFLGFFNVSNNLLEGRIPQGKQFDTFESSSFEGNPGLCGKPLLKGCGSSDASKKREDQGSESSTFAFDWKIVLTGFVSGLIVGVILGNEYFTKIFEWFATNNLVWQLKTAIKRKTRGHRN